MKLNKTIKKLCTPAYVYMVVSVITLLLLAVQNFGNVNTYCVGQYECNVSNTGFVFLLPYTFMILGIASMFSPRPLM